MFWLESLLNIHPCNKGAKHTRYQVTTTQEGRHKLKRAKVHSKFDRGNGQGGDDKHKAKGAGRDDKVQDKEAGQDGKEQGEGAGLDHR